MVVIGLQTDPGGQNTIGARNARLVEVVVGGDPIVPDGIANIGADSDIAGANWTILRTIPGSKHLIEQGGRISAPTGREQSLAADGKFDRINIGPVVAFLKAVGCVLIANGNA